MSHLTSFFGGTRTANALTLATTMAFAGLFSASAIAKDALDGTYWQTIDDDTGKPKAIIKMTEVNGKLVGNIVKLVDPTKKNICNPCSGKYAGKSLAGVNVVWNLKPSGNNTYEDGTILDPKKNKTYKLKGELANNGKELKMRGYVGFSLVGRTQTWQRVK